MCVPWYGGQTRLDEPGRSEPAPVPEADEDDVAGCRRDEAREQRGRERGSEPGGARLDHHHPADDRAAEERGDRRERARAREQGAPLLPQAQERCDGEADDRPERDQRHLGAEDGAERERPQGREGDSGGV